MSKRRRAGLQRLKRSVVVTFSAAAAGSTGCNALSEPGSNADLRGGTAGAGQVLGPAGFGSPPTTNPPVADPPDTSGGAVNPPYPVPCPSTLPTDGTSCVQYYTGPATPSSADGCTIPVNGCGQEYFVRCVDGLWHVELDQNVACNPPPPDAGMGSEDDAGLDDDGGLDGQG